MEKWIRADVYAICPRVRRVVFTAASRVGVSVRVWVDQAAARAADEVAAGIAGHWPDHPLICTPEQVLFRPLSPQPLWRNFCTYIRRDTRIAMGPMLHGLREHPSYAMLPDRLRTLSDGALELPPLGGPRTGADASLSSILRAVVSSRVRAALLYEGGTPHPLAETEAAIRLGVSCSTHSTRT